MFEHGQIVRHRLTRDNVMIIAIYPNDQNYRIRLPDYSEIMVKQYEVEEK